MHKHAGHIISIAKNIWLKRPDDTSALGDKFIPQSYIYAPCPPCIHWWRTNTAERKISELASMLCDSSEATDAKDVLAVTEIIKNILHESCGDARIFDIQSLISQKHNTLLECRATQDVTDFAMLLLNAINAAVEISITTWAGICVAPKIESPSFVIQSHGLYVIAKNDFDFWHNEIVSKFEFNEWSPIPLPGSSINEPAFARLSYNNVFVSISTGTKSRSRMLAQFKLRQLFALVISVAIKSSSFMPHKSGGDPCRVWVQHPSNGSSLHSHMTSSSETLLPCLLNDCILSIDDVGTVKSWYHTLAALDHNISSKIDKSAYFINRAMNASGIESYLNYFISLDALFGVRGCVVDSIENGVKHLVLDAELLEKLAWLTRLRHELVHGGSRSIFEWPEYTRYRMHFMSSPEKDIRRLAFAALLQSTTLPKSAYFQ